MGIALSWAVLYFFLGMNLWRRRPYTRRAIPLLLLLDAIYEFILLIFFIQAPASRASWPVKVVFHLLSISFTYWALNRPAVINYFASSDKIAQQ